MNTFQMKPFSDLITVKLGELNDIICYIRNLQFCMQKSKSEYFLDTRENKIG